MINKIHILILSMFVLVGYGIKQDDNRTEFFPKIEQKPDVIPDKENVWVFILAGQSNMAGRGKVEPVDTIPDIRVFTINKEGELLLAKSILIVGSSSFIGSKASGSIKLQIVSPISKPSSSSAST